MASTFYTHITYNTRTGAERVLSEMQELISRNGYCTIGDYLTLNNFNTSDSEMEERYGWHQVAFSRVYLDEERGVFAIDLPAPVRVVEEKILDLKVEPDLVNHPPHYKTGSGLETIDVIEAFTSDLTGMEAVDTANVIKYICRWKKKNGLQDLKKALWYLNHLINLVEKESK